LTRCDTACDYPRRPKSAAADAIVLAVSSVRFVPVHQASKKGLIMPTRRVALLVVCFVTVSLFAQTPAIDMPRFPVGEEIQEPKPQDPTPGSDSSAEQQHVIPRPMAARGVATNSFENNPPTLPNIAFIASADTTSRPLIVMKLGSVSGSTFHVFDAADFPLFSVQNDGLSKFARDQNSGTLLQISNANAGTSAATAYAGLRFSQGGTLKADISSVGSGSTAAAGGGNALQIWNYANSSTIFATNSTERMRIHGDGKVSIGGANNVAKLNLVSTSSGADGMGAWFNHSAQLSANASQNDIGLYVSAANIVPTGVTNALGVVSVYGEGWNLGNGSATGGGTVKYATGGKFRAGNYPARSGAVTNAYAVHASVLAGTGTVSKGYGIDITDIEATEDWAVYSEGANDSSYFAGNVIIGGASGVAIPVNNVLYVKGESFFDGTVTGTNIKAHYQDVAEWVPAATDLSPGTVVVLNRRRSNEVMASATPYDTTVAGVVSAQPGISLGIEGEGKEQIATTGRVKVRVDARTHPILIGDLLVTSDVSGTAMVSEPMDINGRKFHQPGTIIGKALEPLESGVGEILVLLSLQ
jgi:hypothetical protein